MHPNRSSPIRRLACLGFLLVCGTASVSRAIELGTTGNYDTTSPANDPWNYVGTVNGASGVYLGDYDGTNWVLTAGHVGAGAFTLDGTTYTALADSSFSFSNSGSPSEADLTLFEIDGGPSLSSLTITSRAPGNGSTVEMIGYGGVGEESWGLNTIYGLTEYELSGYGTGGEGIVTLASGENGQGAQGVSGDSGGGMFYETAQGVWELTGILSGIGDVTSGNGTDLGEGTIAVDLANYATQINADIDSVAAIPEPSFFAFALALAALGGAAFRRSGGVGTARSVVRAS